MNVLSFRKCHKCESPISRVVNRDGVVSVEAYASRRGDPVKALHAGKATVVDSTRRTTWRRLTGPTEVTCSRGHKVTISPAVEIERATGVRPQEIENQAELAEGIARAIAFAYAHPSVLDNDPSFDPGPLDYAALASATEQVANAAPSGYYGFG
ncbi:MAG: hypothetical protein ACYCWN_07645 [Ferrimicrobium sp.]